MKKRIIGFALSALLLALSFPAEAQQAKKVPRIGLLRNDTPSLSAPRIEAFRHGLSELGYIEGKNIALEYHYAEGETKRLPKLAAELVGLNVDVIVAAGPGILPVKNATKTIPIVMAQHGDPVGAGLVASLARPGGNVTGLSSLSGDLGGKQLDLLKEAFPTVSRVAVLWSRTGATNALWLEETKVAVRALQVTLQPLEVRSSDDFDPTFSAIRSERASALMVLRNAVTFTHRTRILDFVAAIRLPAMYQDREFVDAGGLMSYATEVLDLYRRVAYFVDKILKGTKPADLPVQQPTKFELMINQKTAKQIGLTIPQSMLYRADRVIK
jgi:putative ABC transport system substrate-binding protein